MGKDKIVKFSYKVAEGVLKRPRRVAKRKVEKFSKLARDEYASRRGNEWPSLPPMGERFEPNVAPGMRRTRRAHGEGNARWWRERPTESDPVSAHSMSQMRLQKDKPQFTSAVMDRKHNPKRPLNITKEQWDMLMGRITTRESGVARIKAAPGPGQMPGVGQEADELLRVQPPETRVMGRINEPIMSGGEKIGVQPKDYPYPEAAIRYLKGMREGKPMLPGESVPPVDRMSVKGDQVAYERQVWKPVADPIKRASAAAEDVNKEMIQQTPQTSDYIGKKGDLKARGQKVVDSVKKVHKDQTPSEELVKIGMLGDRLWKFIGGQRTLTGKLWNNFRQNARGRYKVQDTRDYFIRSFLRWSQDPDAFEKLSRSEAKSINTIWEQFKREFGDDL